MGFIEVITVAIVSLGVVWIGYMIVGIIRSEKRLRSIKKAEAEISGMEKLEAEKRRQGLGAKVFTDFGLDEDGANEVIENVDENGNTLSRDKKGKIIIRGVDGSKQVIDPCYPTYIPFCTEINYDLTVTGSAVENSQLQPVIPKLGKGKKNDRADNKPMMSLVEAEFVNKVAAVMTYGAKKYGKFNYRGGLEYTRVLDAALRHIYAYIEGEDKDPESGLCHIGHAGACLNILAYQMKNKGDLDDRLGKTRK